MIYVMSGGAKAFAVIGVTYPAGSVCTCTDGCKTLTLKDTGGQGFFLIPYAAAWTVTATDGTNTKAQSVEITSEGQSENVTLNYSFEIFNGGAIVPFTTIEKPHGKVTVGETILFEIGESGTYEKGATAYTTDALDLTDYDRVVFEGSFSQVVNSNGDKSRAGVTTVTPHANDTNQMYVASAELDTTNGEWMVDISALTGNHYICVSAGNGYVDNLIGSITRIYLA